MGCLCFSYCNGVLEVTRPSPSSVDGSPKNSKFRRLPLAGAPISFPRVLKWYFRQNGFQDIVVGIYRWG